MARTSTSLGSSGSSRSCTSRTSSRKSSFSQNPNNSRTTNTTSYGNTQATFKQYGSTQVYKPAMHQKTGDFFDEGIVSDSSTSLNTYASTQVSEEELSKSPSSTFPRERRQCFDPDAVPSSSTDFAALFPSNNRIMIQHDDSTIDGNMNLRVDTNASTTNGRKQKMTLFHLRMKDLQERDFSLRRYWRNSGREVANSRRQYARRIPNFPNLRRSDTRPAAQTKRQPPVRQDSGYESEEEEFEERLRSFTIANSKPNIRTDNIKLEFSNYAQVIVEPSSHGNSKQYQFEYWGECYTWKKRFLKDGDEIIPSYECINLSNQSKVSSIVPDALSREESRFEARQGAWIPACSMRLLQSSIPDDLGDVIVATGLIALVDDCIAQR